VSFGAKTVLQIDSQTVRAQLRVTPAESSLVGAAKINLFLSGFNSQEAAARRQGGIERGPQGDGADVVAARDRCRVMSYRSEIGRLLGAVGIVPLRTLIPRYLAAPRSSPFGKNARNSEAGYMAGTREKLGTKLVQAQSPGVRDLWSVPFTLRTASVTA
jgi:hypothetical protein